MATGDRDLDLDLLSRRFSTARRGYDRSEVDAFRDEVSALVTDLSARVGDLEARLENAPSADEPDLETEFATISSEVGAILETARTAAEGMRSRASADAARWRAEADAEVRTVRDEAAADAVQTRRDAWETGTTMLTQAAEEAERIVESARHDALFIRAEAEREALRLTSDARRDREEEVRTARTEAERLVLKARSESESILDSARRSAEAAQERARALEQRRAELMEELEAARQSIGELEEERREVFQAPPEPADRYYPGAHMEETDWRDEDLAIRILPTLQVSHDQPVDADAMAAEVEQMRRQPAPPPPPEPAVPSIVSEPAVAVQETPVGADLARVEEPISEEPAAIEVTPAPADMEADLVEHAEPDAPDAADEPPSLQAPAISEPEVVEESAAPQEPPARDDLASLFASLRTPGAAPEHPTAIPSSPEVESAQQAVEAAAPPVQTPIPSTPLSPAPVTAAKAKSRPGPALDPFELRDRVLLPIENRALRAIKRKLVDLQNRVLEELRVAATWAPETAMFTAAFESEIGQACQEATVGGYSAAAELAGVDRTPQPWMESIGTGATGFALELSEAVLHALDRAREGDAGSRQLAAAASRVFRAWRTDEAERRLRLAAYGAYHEGLMRAFPLVGVEAVVGVSPGHPCGRCPAGTGVTWAPGEALPAGRSMPPATATCSCTIVPAGA